METRHPVRGRRNDLTRRIRVDQQLFRRDGLHLNDSGVIRLVRVFKTMIALAKNGQFRFF